MFLDALLVVSDAQAFTAAAVSTNSIDLTLTTPGRQVGTGEPIGFGLAADVLLSATSMLVEVISATDAALTAGIIVHSTRTILAADFTAGALAFVGVPMGMPTQRYLGLRITPTGGAATVTLTAWLTAQELFSIATRNYPKGYTV
jgi:hypothetical protein